jgi:hypothetical protein
MFELTPDRLFSSERLVNVSLNLPQEKRKLQREEEKEREEEEMLRADSLDETRQQLEKEKLVNPLSSQLGLTSISLLG